MQQKDRDIWVFPWSYKEGVTIGVSLLMVGFFIEKLSSSNSAFALLFPYNLYLGIAFLISLLFVYFLFSNSNLFRFLISVPAAISSMMMLVVFVLIMGVIPQDPSYGGDFIQNFGLNSISVNWAFLLNIFYFLLLLGLLTIDKIYKLWKGYLKFNLHSASFVLSHFGLWFTILTATLGSGDLQRLTIKVDSNDYYNVAVDQKGNEVELDFFIRLNTFTLKEYNPKIAIVDNISGQTLVDNPINFIEIKDSVYFEFSNYKFKIQKYLENSAPIGNMYAPVVQTGSVPSALVEINFDGQKRNEWFSCGNFMYPYRAIKLDDKHSILMTIPETKFFQSNINIVSKETVLENVLVEVNKAYNYSDYKIYQYSYNEKLGKWSDYTTLELVKDPWIIPVYFGLVLLTISSVILIFLGNKQTNK